MQGYLSEHGVKWQFSLSKASWWGEMFERMDGLIKQVLYKVVGSAKLTIIILRGRYKTADVDTEYDDFWKS